MPRRRDSSKLLKDLYNTFGSNHFTANDAREAGIQNLQYIHRLACNGKLTKISDNGNHTHTWKLNEIVVRRIEGTAKPTRM